MYFTIGGGILVLNAWQWRRQRDDDLYKGEVISFEGRVSFKSVKKLGMYNTHVYHYLLIADQQFLISSHLIEAMDYNGLYRVYFAPFSEIMLSAEQLEDDPFQAILEEKPKREA